MQALDYWKQFADSGKVEDYLSYVSNDKLRGGDGGCLAGEELYAGINMRNGDDIETGAYRGV